MMKRCIQSVILAAFMVSVSFADKDAGWQKQVGVAYVTPDDKKAGTYEGKVALGFQQKSGNTEQNQFDFGLTVLRHFESSRVKFRGQKAYEHTDGTDKTDNAMAGLLYSYDVTERSYFVSGLSWKYDDIADLTYRYTLNAGCGMRVYRSERSEAGMEAGPSYIVEKLGGTESDYLAAFVGLNAKHTFANGADCWADGTYIPRLDEFSTYLLHGEMGVNAPVYGGLGLQVTLTDDYNSLPAAGKEKNDFVVRGGVTYKF
ncbi:MAG: DUF481 domain-containing protein [Spartobacteria bacterium]|nr:DUF481 domain-containing protein [Spartobacteria bacterium]